MTSIESIADGHIHWQFDSEIFPTISPELFTAEYWQSQEAILGQETGRGTTWFVRHDHHDLVLRHYLRGGFMQKISKDSYLYTNLKSCRSIGEFNILAKLHQLGFPVPKPAAAQVVRHGLGYQADLLTHKIPNAQDLVQVLKIKQNEEFYIALGKTIAEFHAQGIFHADLNIQNILQDKDKQFWLIDFDRAKRLKPDVQWQQNNLKRLKRSFKKEQLRFGIQWQEQDWEIFDHAYQAQL